MYNQNQMLMQQNMMMQQQMEQMQQQINQIAPLTEYKDLAENLESFEYGIVVKQKFDIMEMMTGASLFPNIYHVYRKDVNGKMKGDKEFKYYEKSSYCQSYATGCNPIQMKCYNLRKAQDNVYCMRWEKDCKCEYYCCNREQILAWRSENGQENYLGKIYEPWQCCNFLFEIYDDSGDANAIEGSQLGNLDYTITGSMCQCYFWCTCPCDSCQLVEFEIRKAGNEDIVGQVVQKGRGCAANAFMNNDADILSVDFPEGSNWRQRAMLMNFAIFVNYTLFNVSYQQTQES